MTVTPTTVLDVFNIDHPLACIEIFGDIGTAQKETDSGIQKKAALPVLVLVQSRSSAKEWNELEAPVLPILNIPPPRLNSSAAPTSSLSTAFLLINGARIQLVLQAL